MDQSKLPLFRTYRLALILTVLCCFDSGISVFCQANIDVVPYGLNEPYKSQLAKQLKSNDAISLSTEDLKRYTNVEGSSPLFAIPMTASVELESQGINWKAVDDKIVAWVKLDLVDAKGISLLLEDIDLNQGDHLYIYDQSGKHVHGAFTNKDILPSGKFITDIVKGDEIIMEVVRPQKSEKIIPFKINKIYKVINENLVEQQSMEVDTGFMASMACHQNINCALGEEVQTEKQSVTRIMMVLEEGLGWCTGALMNNTNENGDPLILSAFHCQDGFTPLWDLYRFDFNFETTGCDNPNTRPSFQSIQGCSYLAGRLETDFVLLRLSENVPAEYNPYFAGWDRRGDYAPTPTRFIHHPAGDIKKISVDTDDLRVWTSSTIWNNDTRTPAGSHFRLNLESGNHEPGSSGGPLFDESGRVIGQLHGGNTNEECTLTRAYFGRLSQSWDNGDTQETRLMEWLDPAGTGVEQLDGIDNESIASTITISGIMETQDGEPVNQVILTLSGESSSTVMTNADGTFTFSELPADGTYSISFEKDIETNNGLSASDLSQMVRHILGLRPFTNEIQILAGDVNNNGNISATDLVEVQNVILGLKEKFNNGDSWGFLPESIEIVNGQVQQSDLRIIAYKKGDVNFTADPKK